MYKGRGLTSGCMSGVILNPTKGTRRFPEQETLSSLLSTDWTQERVRVRFT